MATVVFLFGGNPFCSMRCSVTCSEVVWRFRHAIAALLALCTQEFFRLGLLAYLEGVCNVLRVLGWVGALCVTKCWWSVTVTVVTGVVVLKSIESLFFF